MEFKNLLKAVIEQEEKDHKERLARIERDGLKEVMEWYGKKYKGTEEQQRIKFYKYLLLQQKRRVTEAEQQLKAVSEAPAFSEPFVITVEWKKSRMWRSNPKSYTNYGFEGSYIGGCGYDKLSTATAEALNSHLPILKELYQAKEQKLNDWLKINPGKDSKNDFNRSVLGYGSGYNILPKFEGGVGIDSHRQIIERLGLKWSCVTSTNNTDVFMISGS